MFQGGKAEEAMKFYASVLPNTEIRTLERYGPNGPGPEGSVMMGLLSVSGLEVRCTDSPIKHAFDFTPSFSFFVDCETEEQVTRAAAALSEGGAVLMPQGNYGFSRSFAWVNDRFGVSWQLNLP
jgi:predicted 3-demethylubiquinone-9 3-methyltransferase (glyoxalase superfamily)